MTARKIGLAIFPLAFVAGCAQTQTPTLTGGKWVIEDIAGAAVVENTRVSLKFDADGTLSGSGGCNGYTGAYTLNRDEISIGPIASTKKACPPPIMAQESRFFGILSAASRIARRDDGALELISDDLGAVIARR